MLKIIYIYIYIYIKENITQNIVFLRNILTWSLKGSLMVAGTAEAWIKGLEGGV